MKTKKNVRLSQMLHYVFIGLTVSAAVLMLLNLSAEFGIGGGQPFVRGWVTTVQEPAAAPVLLPHPDGSGDLKVYSFNQPKFVTLQFDNMSSLLQSRYLGQLLLQKLGWVLVIVILYQFMRIFRNLDRGLIFREENIRRIRYIALAVPAVAIANFAASRLLAGITYTAEGHTITTAAPAAQFEFILFSGLLALVILALVEIFRNGAQLQQEQDLTI
jgi:Protein of unknown function (DUF2975)